MSFTIKSLRYAPRSSLLLPSDVLNVLHMAERAIGNDAHGQEVLDLVAEGFGMVRDVPYTKRITVEQPAQIAGNRRRP